MVLSARDKYARTKEIWDWITVRFDHEDGKKIREMAKRENCSLSEVVRKLVAWGLE